MAATATIDTYGGEKVDARAVSNPTSQLSAAHHNRQSEDVAHLTRTAPKAIVRFPAGGGNPALGDTYTKTQWGSSNGEKPTIVRTGAGRYTLTWTASYTDALGTVETLDLFDAHVSVRTSDATDDLECRVLTVAANVVTVEVESPRNTPADAGNSSGVPLNVTVWVY